MDDYKVESFPVSGHKSSGEKKEATTEIFFSRYENKLNQKSIKLSRLAC